MHLCCLSSWSGFWNFLTVCENAKYALNGIFVFATELDVKKIDLFFLGEDVGNEAPRFDFKRHLYLVCQVM